MILPLIVFLTMAGIHLTKWREQPRRGRIVYIVLCVAAAVLLVYMEAAPFAGGILQIKQNAP